MRNSVSKNLLRSLFLVAGIFLSCGGDEPTPSTTPRVDLVPVTVEEWRTELSQRAGSITVVDMWATWCYPCLERFPKMVEMQQRYAPDGVEFLSLCLDDPDDRDAIRQARSFLEEQGAAFSHYRISENLFTAFEKLDIQSIPAVFVYDENGELRHKLTGDDPDHQFTDSDVEEAILELLRHGQET